MNRTERLGLTQYQEGDKFRITQDTDSLNNDMQILDEAIGGKMSNPTNDGETDQILRRSADGTHRWDNAATPTEIGNAVKDWLDENIPTGTTVVVDPTLSVPNAAAEAKTTGTLCEMSPNLVELEDGTYTSHGVTMIVDGGKVTVKNRKTDADTAVVKVSKVFNLSAGTYYFGAREAGNLGGLYLQLRKWDTGDLGNIIQTPGGFVKFTIAEATGAAVRIAIHPNDTYDVNGVDIYPEIIPVTCDEDYVPFGLVALDSLARKQNELMNYGFLSRYTQKRISIIGDSISSYRDMRYCGDYVYYYPVGDVNSVEKTWWKRLADASGSVIAFNESEAGAFVTNQRGVVIPGSDRDDFYQRTLTLLSRNVAPDLIFVALGTNDGAHAIALGDYDFTHGVGELSEETFRTAYIKGIRSLKTNFPTANIVCLIFMMPEAYATSIRTIADYFGLECITVQNYSIYSSVHPNDLGSRQIASAILNSRKQECFEHTNNLLSLNMIYKDYESDNIVIRNLGDGRVYVRGTPSIEKAISLGKLTLTEGTYICGVLLNREAAPDTIQIRDYTGGVDNGNLVPATNTRTTITIAEGVVQDVNIRIHITAGKTYDDVFMPMLTSADKWPFISMGSDTAIDYDAREDGVRAWKYYFAEKYDDLNDVPVGYVPLDSQKAYDNAPYNYGRSASVFTFGDERIDSEYRVQYYIIQATTNHEVYRRKRGGGTGGTWTEWIKIYDKADFEYLNKSATKISPVTSTDLNDMTTSGVYILSSTTDYDNQPMSEHGACHLVVYEAVHDNVSYPYLLQYFYTDSTNHRIYLRRRVAGNWQSWFKLYDYEESHPTVYVDDNYLKEFIRDESESQGANTGLNLRVLSYNICHFNHDSSTTYINDSQLLELRRMFSRVNAEILLHQEDDEFIDLNDSQTSMAHVYYPMYPYRYSVGGTSIHSKVACAETRTLLYSNGRGLRYALFVFGDVKLLAVTTHPVANYSDTGNTSPESIAARATQYTELCQWVNGDRNAQPSPTGIALQEYNTSNYIYAPTHTHVIIGADTNAITDTDWENLIEQVSAANLIMANGGRFGKIYTCEVNNESKKVAIDNIIVTQNVIINNFEVLSSLDKKLWSDHVPIYADVTLR